MAMLGTNVARKGDLVLTGGGTGPLSDQLAAILKAITRAGAKPADLAMLRVFYRHGDSDEASLAADIARALPKRVRPVLTLVPVAHAGPADGAVSVEAAAVVSHVGQLRRDLGDGPLLSGTRRGQFLFLSGATGAAPDGIVSESRAAMQELGYRLRALGAGFGDVVRMNRWYHAAGTKEDWAPSARAVAAFYSEPGPIATALSLPVALPGGFSIRIELMAMLAEDGRALPKRHSWPEGSWDWPIHLPYKHGLACGGLGFIGGQVSLDERAEVLFPDHLDRQVARALANIDRVAAGLGGKGHVLLHMGAYHELPEGGLHSGQPGAKALLALASGKAPVALVGFDNLSYPKMRVEIEAVVALDED